MDIPSGIEKIFEKLGWNTARIVALPYLLFLLVCCLYWLNLTEITKEWFLYAANNWTIHIFPAVCLIASIISLFLKDNWKKLGFHIKQIFQKEPIEEETAKLFLSNLTEKDFVESLMQWTKDAHQVYIFGGSANFLNKKDENKDKEFNELKKLGNKCKLLITDNFTANIENLWELASNGVQIRTYPKGDIHIRGRLKRDTSGVKSYLCSKKDGKYTTQSIQSPEVSNMILSNFDELFNNGNNPFIKCIMFDKGGVWCDLCDNEWKLNEPIQKLAIKLKEKGYTIAIHSNCDSETGEKLKIENYFKEFRLFLSYEIGYKKPEFEFYNTMLNRLNIKPFECVFIDDSFVNLDKAKELGLNTINVSTYSNSTDKLESIVNQLEKIRVKTH